MWNNQKSALILIFIIMTSIPTTKAGPIACQTCLMAVGAIIGGTGTAAGGCFTLMFPPAICSCLAGLGISVGLAGLIMCIPPCIAPTPWYIMKD